MEDGRVMRMLVRLASWWKVDNGIFLLRLLIDSSSIGIIDVSTIRIDTRTQTKRKKTNQSQEK
ncbi:hypothetical protein N7450_003726 [Penicillium hetheringtonii]|uniref:Uncharacterized protein n=1 Tax=Penicillium hetheringtonii TaxID=911720 RepID=A0AAD6GVP9_9EURO|nr:hypothetical protein N7450_003726 [Penicillium hetheringtonii]